MPLYDIRCENSGKVFERIIPLANFEAPIECACGARASRLISRPMISVDHTGYQSPITGEWIGSKRQHREDLEKHGCRVLEQGETAAAASRRERDDIELDRKVEETVEREIEAYSSDKRERLYNELTHNELVVERR